MQVLKSYDKNGNINTDKLTDNFITYVPGSQIRNDDGTASDITETNRIESLPVTVVVDGYDFIIWGSGEVTGEGEDKPTQDKLNITNLNLTSTTDSITAKVQVSNGNGATYTYYYKMSSSSDWIEAHTGSETSYTITGLEPNTSYDVKVDATNGNENASKTGTISTQSKEIPSAEGRIEFGQVQWNNGTASVTVSKGTGVDENLQIQYQIVTDSNSPTEGAYQAIANGGTVSEIANGSTVYARLWNGTNGGSPASIKIEDTIAPTVSVNKDTIGEKSIAVNVVATDNETGMPSPASYKYYIKKSTDGSYPSTPTATEPNSSYTFNGLTSNTSYDIKVEVADNAGNTGSGELKGIKTLTTIPDANVDGTINVSEPNWKGDGTASVTVTKGEDVDDSLSIEYKKEGDSSYTKLNDGGTIDGLVNGDKIYIHLTDGTRVGADKVVTIEDKTAPTAEIKLSATSVNTDGSITATVTQTDNESGIDITKTKYVYNTTSGEIGTNEQNYIGGTFSKNPQDIILNATAEGTYYLHVLSVDKAGNKKETISEAITVEAAGGDLPGDIDGLTPVEGDEDTGIVAKDEAGNEWVWVEVPKSIYTTAKSDTDYDAIYNDMKTYTSDYSENGYTDSYISGSGNFSSPTDYNNEKNRMLKSVYDNGGFWISRYEIGSTSASEAVSTNISVTPVSQQNAYPIVNKTQPQSQQIVRKLNSQANLLFGIQWDLTMKFLQEKGGLNVEDITIDSTSWGNYSNAMFTIDRGQYNANWGSSKGWSDAYNERHAWQEWCLTTGAVDRNRKMNIYDLAGNIEEWTLENYSSSDVVYRGGNGGGSYGNYRPANNRIYDNDTSSANYIGSRAALYGEGGTQLGGGSQGGSGTTEPQTGAIKFGDLQWDSSNTTASVTVSKTEDNTLDLQYKINEGEWTTIQSGGTIQNLKDGDLVTACLFDGTNRGYYATLNVVAPKTEIEAGEIASKPNDYYGGYVNYKPSDGDPNVKWRIFYAGTNPNDRKDTTSRIYLIADDYIEADYAPDGKNGTEMNKSYPYQVWFTDMVDNGDYIGSNDITNSLVKPWLSFLNSSYGRYNTNENMQVVAYMLDTNVWSIFKDNEGKAEYAIGGPTLDMFCASYNQKYTNKQIQYKSDNNGYSMKWSTDSSYSSDFGLDGLQKSDSLYVINSNDRAYHMWIASPAASDYTDYSIVITYDGRLYGDYYCGYAGGNIPNGFRPIICLKSDAKLVKQSDGTYNIE